VLDGGRTNVIGWTAPVTRYGIRPDETWNARQLVLGSTAALDRRMACRGRWR
jgi:hypothetical protein